jgi:2-polyprenyl-3-methyl-5-hydroxy-6-metoxy-1,4-benzoquinol methylase
MEQRCCPACGERCGLLRGEKNKFQLLSCRNCKTLYTGQNPAAGEWEDYDGYYTPENLAVPDFINKRLDEIVQTFRPHRHNNRLLDVGCGAGSFLEAAGRDGWQAYGIEISKTAAAHVRSRGIEVFCGELQNAKFPDEHFDVVIASEVLEHVPYPQEMLTAIARVLRPGGLLWATTPHGRGISARMLDLAWSPVCPPEHLQLFSVSSIKSLLKGAGFKEVSISTHGVNPFEIFHELYGRVARRSNSQNGSGSGSSFNRVESSYQLTEFISDRPSRRMLKETVNGLLNLGRFGDSLKIHAEK